ncbi:hypothetical protein ACT7DG_00175 [Bacillus cereus]
MEELYQPDDEVATFIMSLVEMIILPHLEVPRSSRETRWENYMETYGMSRLRNL